MYNREELQDLFDAAYGYSLSFEPSSRVQSLRVGDWESAFSGAGIEFEGLREQLMGEDVRRLHARQSARLGRPIEVQRTEFREARAIILFDVSPSMYLRDKMSTAFIAASMIMHSASVLHMPLGLWVVGARQNIEVRPKIGEEHFYVVADVLMDAICGDNSNAVDAEGFSQFPFESLRSFLASGAFLFPISDFLGLGDEDLIPTILSEPEGFDAIPVIVQDEWEYSHPVSIFGKWGKEVPLHDVEDPKQSGGFWMSAQTAREKREVHEVRFAKLLRRFRDQGFLYSHLSTSDVAVIFEKLQTAL